MSELESFEERRAKAFAIMDAKASLLGFGNNPDAPAYSIPQNVEAEAALLGTMLTDAKMIEWAADFLAPEDFFDPLHRRIFETTVLLASQGKAVSPVTLKPYFQDDEGLKELGGVSYLARLASDLTGFLNPAGNIEQIKDLAIRRRMQAGLHTAVGACSDIQSPILEIVADVDAALEIRDDNSVVSVSGAEAVADLIKGFDEPKGGVICGTIPELDRVLGQLRKKQLIILGARPGMGKTAVAVSYAVGAAKKGFGVLFISLEMSARELAGRMVADLCWTGGDNSVPYQAIVEQRLNDFHMRRVCEAETGMHSLPLQIIDTDTLKTGQLKRLIKRNKRRFESRGQSLDLVIVDYLQLMHTDHRSNSQYERISEISQSLKATAKGFDVALMALAQLSREVEKRPGKRPIRSDLRDSGQIEQDADTILFLLREEYYLNEDRPHESSPKYPAWQESMDAVKGRIEFIVAKQRAGREGFAVGEFHAEYQAVR